MLDLEKQLKIALENKYWLNSKQIEESDKKMNKILKKLKQNSEVPLTWLDEPATI